MREHEGNHQVKPFEELDAGMIDEFRELQREGAAIVEIVDLFRRTSAERLESLQSAVDRGELGLLGATAHSLRGSTGSVGVWRAAALCDVIEAAARRGEVPSTVTLQQLQECIAAAQVELDATFPTSGVPHPTPS